jgi:hypothetical protein
MMNKWNLELGNPAKTNGKEDRFACLLAVLVAVHGIFPMVIGWLSGYRIRILMENEK